MNYKEKRMSVLHSQDGLNPSGTAITSIAQANRPKRPKRPKRGHSTMAEPSFFIIARNSKKIT